MESSHRKDTVFNCVVVFAAWFVMIAACIPGDGDPGAARAPVAHQAE